MIIKTVIRHEMMCGKGVVDGWGNEWAGGECMDVLVAGWVGGWIDEEVESGWMGGWWMGC